MNIPFWALGVYGGVTCVCLSVTLLVFGNKCLWGWGSCNMTQTYCKLLLESSWKWLGFTLNIRCYRRVAAKSEKQTERQFSTRRKENYEGVLNRWILPVDIPGKLQNWIYDVNTGLIGTLWAQKNLTFRQNLKSLVFPCLILGLNMIFRRLQNARLESISSTVNINLHEQKHKNILKCNDRSVNLSFGSPFSFWWESSWHAGRGVVGSYWLQRQLRNPAETAHPSNCDAWEIFTDDFEQNCMSEDSQNLVVCFMSQVSRNKKLQQN